MSVPLLKLSLIHIYDDQGAGVFGGPVKHGSRSPVKIKELFHHFFQIVAGGRRVNVGPFNHQEKSVGIPGKGIQGLHCGLAENVAPFGGRGKITRSGDNQRFSGRQGLSLIHISSTGYSGASATDFHRLPLPALERNESQKETSRKKNV